MIDWQMEVIEQMEYNQTFLPNMGSRNSNSSPS
jgi:hypothetical protein